MASEAKYMNWKSRNSLTKPVWLRKWIVVVSLLPIKQWLQSHWKPPSIIPAGIFYNMSQCPSQNFKPLQLSDRLWTKSSLTCWEKDCGWHKEEGNVLKSPVSFKGTWFSVQLRLSEQEWQKCLISLRIPLSTELPVRGKNHTSSNIS
jgi:hypothetical protein